MRESYPGSSEDSGHDEVRRTPINEADPLISHYMTHQDGLFMGGVALGCTPVWSGCLWECRCPGATHGVGTTYTALTTASLERARHTL